MKQRFSPTPGFWLLMGTSLAVLIFFIWGFSTPRLDRIWELEEGLKTGRVTQLSRSEKNTFYDVFEDYPDYLEELAGRRGIDLMSSNSDGLSLTDKLVLIRKAALSDCGNFVLDVSGEQSEFPIIFSVQGRSWQKEVEVKVSGRNTVLMPKDVLVPEFIEVARKNNNGQIGNVDVKVRFCE
ncbi:MAG: hypothetical protein JXR76_11630 [Deltaproteobacteria bacterium]|nr:hypothetical protein [Deltaproteobacteria bacterium]